MRGSPWISLQSRSWCQPRTGPPVAIGRVPPRAFAICLQQLSAPPASERDTNAGSRQGTAATGLDPPQSQPVRSFDRLLPVVMDLLDLAIVVVERDLRQLREVLGAAAVPLGLEHVANAA